MFGKLTPAEEAESKDQSELKQHVVGLLFNTHGKNLSNLQQQVCQHIVHELHKETDRLRQLVLKGSPIDAEDVYSFELHSMLVALAGSQPGADFIAQRPSLVRDLLSSLHFSTPRVQRQVVVTLRRVMPVADPAKWNMAFAASSALHIEAGLYPVLLLAIAKGLEVQLRSKAQGRTSSTVRMGTVVAADESFAEWIKGAVSAEVTADIIKLIGDICSGALVCSWNTLFKVGRFFLNMLLLFLRDCL